jgi:transposase
MIHLTSETKILLAGKPVDFRNQVDGLVSICKNYLNENPLSGKLFIFINRNKTMVRILVYENNGYWVMTKRLSIGKFIWPNDARDKISHIHASYLRKLLSGLCK